MRIDWWTLALQTVNVMVLIWLLSRFLFRPVAEIVAKRQEQAKKILSDAMAARREAADAQADADRMRAEIAAERDRFISEARNAARAEREDLLAQASQEVAKLRSEAGAAMARDRVAADRQIIMHASELSIEIAQRLLVRLGSKVALSAFLNGLCQELRALSSEARLSFTAAPPDQPVEVVTAVPLSNEEIEDVRRALREVFNLTIPIAFRRDAALIAGVELHGNNTIVRNSWRADLDRLRVELGIERHYREP
jgi:F-type H+-transporting ATPase subunit b